MRVFSAFCKLSVRDNDPPPKKTKYRPTKLVKHIQCFHFYVGDKTLSSERRERENFLEDGRRTLNYYICAQNSHFCMLKLNINF